MDMAQAFELNRSAIAAQVRVAAERQPVEASEDLSLATAINIRDNGSVSLYQPGATVTLTRSQAIEVMNRIAAMVLGEQVGAMR